jgi:hypothetical protein
LLGELCWLVKLNSGIIRVKLFGFNERFRLYRLVRESRINIIDRVVIRWVRRWRIQII